MDESRHDRTRPHFLIANTWKFAAVISCPPAHVVVGLRRDGSRQCSPARQGSVWKTQNHSLRRFGTQFPGGDHRRLPVTFRNSAGAQVCLRNISHPSDTMLKVWASAGESPALRELFCLTLGQKRDRRWRATKL